MQASSRKKIRLQIIEDNRLLREGIAAIIQEQPDIKVVAASGGSDNALLKAHKLKPQVILLDLGLQNQDGVQIVKSVSKELPQVKVIGMGLIPSQSDVVEFVQAGASGFILKDATTKDLLGTIRSVAGGAKILPPPADRLPFFPCY